MNADSRMTLRWPAVIAAAVALLAIGAGIAYVVMRSAARPTVGAAVQPVAPGRPAGASGAQPPAGRPMSDGALPDVVVTLTPEAIERAGIRLSPVTAGTGGSRLRLPGVIEANAYKQVVVTPLVAGRVTQVRVELGQSVRRGQEMAEIFSPELSEAETRYISARAELDAHERELQRTEKLVEIGAASRQELERLHAEHTSKLTSVDSARSRLELLGLSGSAIAGLAPGKDVGAVIAVPAPITGVVTERMANPGVNVDSTTKMFTVVDLSTVWVVADVYEKDFSRVHVGSTASVTTKAYADVVLPGRVSYIDPQVNPTTRTAKARVEVSNPREQLRLGMFADVSIEDAEYTSIARIPRTAVQNVDNRTVVYLADPRQAGRFIEREVHLGDPSGSDVDVVSGLEQGDSIVSDGSFFVRAERERQGLRPARVSQSGGTVPDQATRIRDPWQGGERRARAAFLSRVRFAGEVGIRGARCILERLSFPEPCGHPGFQPSPKHTLEGCLPPNESTAAVPVSTAGHSGVAIAPDAEFDARWAAWRTRGIAHERAVRRKLTLVACVAGSVATAVAIAYTFLRP